MTRSDMVSREYIILSFLIDKLRFDHHSDLGKSRQSFFHSQKEHLYILALILDPSVKPNQNSNPNLNPNAYSKRPVLRRSSG